jgi:predicted  nucleic acid-binding Zn-ribbon protein
MPGLQTVYQLQVADLERADVARRLQEAEKGLGETEELRRTRDNLQRQEARLSRLRTQIRDLELELSSLTARITATEQRLYGGDVRNPKELASLEADLGHLRGRRERLEDSILMALTDSDESEVRLKQTQEEWQALHHAWEDDQARLRAAVASLRAQLARLDERIAGLRGALPASLLELYDDTRRKKGGRGIAAVRAGLCEGCRVAVPTSVVQQLRRGDETVRCGSCGRVLCVVE